MQLRKKSHKKIPCYVLIFDQIEIIQKTLDFLVQYSNKLDLFIIENPSDNTPEIKQIVDTHGKAGLIRRHYLFNKNITSTAFELVINNDLAKLQKSPYVLITDGDLVAEQKTWLDEEITILEQNPSVFACGVSLDMSNLPVVAFPDATSWVPSDRAIYPTFFEAVTGGHLLLFRGREFSQFMLWKNKHGLNFVDGVMHRYCYEELHKKWARTKDAKAYHLTWDLYANIDHPYTNLKTKKNFQDTWYHSQKAGYILTEY